MKTLVAAATLAVLGTTGSPPARLQVVATEYNLARSRPTIKAGEALIQLANFGEDPHDLRLQRIGGKRVYAIGVVNPGDVKTLDAKLLPGTFRLWCSIANHRALGMSATLIVKK